METNIKKLCAKFDEAHAGTNRGVQFRLGYFVIDGKTPSEVINKALTAGVLRFNSDSQTWEKLNEKSSFVKADIRFYDSGPEYWWKNNYIFA